MLMFVCLLLNSYANAVYLNGDKKKRKEKKNQQQKYHIQNTKSVCTVRAIFQILTEMKCKWNEFTDLHKLEGSLKVFHRVHFDSEELHAHDEADDALHHVRTLLFLPQLFQLCDELLTHCLKPAQRRTSATSSYRPYVMPRYSFLCVCAWDIGMEWPKFKRLPHASIKFRHQATSNFNLTT